MLFTGTAGAAPYSNCKTATALLKSRSKGKKKTVHSSTNGDKIFVFRTNKANLFSCD